MLPCQPMYNNKFFIHLTDDENSKFFNIQSKNIRVDTYVIHFDRLSEKKTHYVRAPMVSTWNPIESIIYCQQSINRCMVS